MMIHKNVLFSVVLVFLLLSSFMFSVDTITVLSHQSDKAQQAVLKENNREELTHITESDSFHLEMNDSGQGTDFVDFARADLGKSIATIIEIEGKPLEEGYFEGGPYYIYDHATYFTGPETETIVAIAVRGDALPEQVRKDLDELADEQAIHKGVNEMDGYWNEIYESGDHELMIERADEQSTIQVVWFTEKGLFSQ
ncbi:hypothetical protein CR194_09010 [Salipaludibacillus keqinensis]|uniref:DUF4309 domain-containing protein n=1 Tax=Salipaludibacillus keqinensis TaxID=2045207 RepID=A0A323TD72_9BACI|nr:hypothetical protein [Salipaludibacillus keqinensis]PYZ93322.1 hypothetical protein CR194_09010 [Salipaludibacillus keqinensis]